jgi:cell shape-determining protein MreC
MLIRISLVIALIAGLAVGVLNFVQVKEKITTLQTNLKAQTERADTAEKQRDDTKRELVKTTTELNQTKEVLKDTTEKMNAAIADAASQTKRADKLTEDLAKATRERDDAQSELAAYKATGFTPEQISGLGKQLKSLQDALAAVEVENKVLLTRVKKLDNELARYKPGAPPVELPPGLIGKVMVSDPKWNFVVINVGENQGVLERGELLVNRNGQLVAKVVVTSVQKDRCVANVMPGWQIGEVIEGDQVIPAHPGS